MKYDKVFEFSQGVAVVEKDNKFGVIIVGGKEIVHPIYDEISNFEGGVAIAKLCIRRQQLCSFEEQKSEVPAQIVASTENILLFPDQYDWDIYYDNNSKRDFSCLNLRCNIEEKMEERPINLLGQIQITKNGEAVFLPERYDWAYDYDDNLSVVLHNNKYGIIDDNYQEIVECKYLYIDRIKNGYAIAYDGESHILIDKKGNERFRVIDYYQDGAIVVLSLDSTDGLLGVVNKDMELIVPVSYCLINRLDNYYVAVGTDGSKSILSTVDGTLITILEFDKIKSLNDWFITSRTFSGDNKETVIYKRNFSLLLRIPYATDVFTSENGNALFSLGDHGYECNPEGSLLLTFNRFQGVWKCIPHREVRKLYMECKHESFLNGKYEVIVDSENKMGIADYWGKIYVEPKYRSIQNCGNKNFICSICEEKDGKEVILYGLIDYDGHVVIPFLYTFLGVRRYPYLVYSKSPNSCKIVPRVFDGQGHYFDSDCLDFGIITADGEIITEPKYKSIESLRSNNGFIVSVRTRSSFGIINNNGEVLLPAIYLNISYSQYDWLVPGKDSVLCAQLGSFPENKISENGFFLVSGPKNTEYEVPSSLADWCGPFNEEGIASVFRYGCYGKINSEYKIVSLLDNHYVAIPERYEFALNFVNGYLSVAKSGKFGIVNNSFEEIIPCKYDRIEHLSNELFKYKECDKWGIIDIQQRPVVEAKFDEIYNVQGKWYKVRLKNHYGLLNTNGKAIIPVEYSDIMNVETQTRNFWIVTEHNIKGVYDENGLILPLLYNKVEFDGKVFSCEVPGTHCRETQKYKYNQVGEQLVETDNITVAISKEYDVGFESGYGMIRVKKDGKWGIIDLGKDVIVEPKYTFINNFSGAFAIVVEGEVESNSIFDNLELSDFHKCKKGLMDAKGNIVLPVEYDYIKKWENGYYCVLKDGKGSLLSSTLHVAIKPNELYCCYTNLDNRFIKVRPKFLVGEKDQRIPKWGLIDYWGNEIVPVDTFDNIEIIDEFYFIYDGYENDEHKWNCKILNNAGQIIIKDERLFDDIADIFYSGNGLFIFKRWNGYNVGYNVINLQGKVLFNDIYYKCIHIVENGLISIQDCGGWGIADVTGHIIAPPMYLYELHYENGISKVKVDGCSVERNIDEDGRIIQKSGEREILLPKIYYWGSDYVNGLSIVRKVGKYHSSFIGVIDEEGNVVIPPKYEMARIYSNGTILVKTYSHYGLYDSLGTCLLPPIFTDIEFFNQDRMRVVWNLKDASSWSNGDYSPAEPSYQSSNVCVVNDRAALCDIHGKILNDQELLYVGRFRDEYSMHYKKYVKAYKKIEMVDNRVRYKEVGIIDFDGRMVVPAEYDSIWLRDSGYALLKKDAVYIIVNLRTNEKRFFTERNIKHIFEFDSLGRCIFSEDCVYDSHADQWIGPIGVMSLEGVLIEPNMYSHIELLRNELILVADKERKLFGLMDKHGKKLLPVEYSYISFVNDNYASVCLGGSQPDGKFASKPLGGKWGIFSKDGSFTVDCLLDEEQEIVDEKVITRNKDLFSVNAPSILVSDHIPIKTTHKSFDDYGFYNDYDEDSSRSRYSKYGGYNGYDDETIDEAFGGDPSLTWNVD